MHTTHYSRRSSLPIRQADLIGTRGHVVTADRMKCDVLQCLDTWRTARRLYPRASIPDGSITARRQPSSFAGYILSYDVYPLGVET